jgi:hypothetical protein
MSRRGEQRTETYFISTTAVIHIFIIYIFKNWKNNQLRNWKHEPKLIVWSLYSHFLHGDQEMFALTHFSLIYPVILK